MAYINLEKEEDTGLQIHDSYETKECNNDAKTLEKQRLFAHPFSFHGRIRRLEYFISFIIIFVWSSLGNGIAKMGDVWDDVFLLTFIPAYWFYLAQRCKRCHDRGNSGWFQIIPFYGLWLLFGDGDAEENDYGPDPKGRDMWAD